MHSGSNQRLPNVTIAIADVKAASPNEIRINTVESHLWNDEKWERMLAEMREYAPICYRAESRYGAYWSVVGYDEIVSIEARADIFSSASHLDGIGIGDLLGDSMLPSFIAMDGPRHNEQRRSVAPAFAPSEMERLSADLRQRTGDVLDRLPIGVEFDWVETVSIELATGMLAIIFDFPWEDRAKLTLWSNWSADYTAVGDPVRGPIRMRHLQDCADYFTELWTDRATRPLMTDLISLMVHSEAMASLTPAEQLANIILLIVGGNDTTRNSMSGAAIAFDKFPDQFQRLVDDPSLAANAASEIIRWQTPIAHMRRTALEDVELCGHMIRKGDKVVMWYVAANSEPGKFENPQDFIVDRPNARRHLSFGFGIHRCVGARLAEMQIRILFEEMAARRLRVRLAGEPERVQSMFISGYRKLPVMVRLGA
jgi:cytochrome P450